MTHPLFDLLSELEASRTHFTLARHRDDTVQIAVTLVGERVEIDVFEDGHVEVSRFIGDESIVGGRELISELIERSK